MFVILLVPRFNPLFKFQVSVTLLYCIVALPSVPKSNVMPPVFAAAALIEPVPNTIFKSSTSTVVLLIVVVVPSTCKLPAMTTVPVLSPMPAGSIVNVAGPAKYPVVMILPAVPPLKNVLTRASV